jgi:hypothetical protein
MVGFENANTKQYKCIKMKMTQYLYLYGLHSAINIITEKWFDQSKNKLISSLNNTNK